MNKWYEKSGEMGDVIVSTRIRLARNLKKYPFPHKLNLKERKDINEIVTDVLLNGSSALANRFKVIDLDKLNEETIEEKIIKISYISNIIDLSIE